MAHSGEYHRNVIFIAVINKLLVRRGTAGLYYCLNSYFHRIADFIIERNRSVAY